MTLQEVIRFKSGYNPGTGRYKMSYSNVGDRIDPIRLESMRSIKRYFGPGGTLPPTTPNPPTAKTTSHPRSYIDARLAENYPGRALDELDSHLVPVEPGVPDTPAIAALRKGYRPSINIQSQLPLQGKNIQPPQGLEPMDVNKTILDSIATKRMGGSIRKLAFGGKTPYNPRTGEYTPEDYTDPTTNSVQSRFSGIKFPSQQSVMDNITSKRPITPVGVSAPVTRATSNDTNINDLLPFGSNIVNSFRKLPNPIAPPNESPINPALVNYDADRAAIDKDYRSFAKETDYRVSNPAIASAIKATGLGKKIQGENQLAQQEGNTNAFIKNSTAQNNQQVNARNIERTREFNDQTISRNINQQRLRSENLANAGDKLQLQRRDKAQIALENRKLDILPTLYKDTGVFGRNYADMNEAEKKALGLRQFGGKITRYKSGGSIHINPANKGKFNALKARTGKSTEELTHSKNPLTRKRAVFAQNAKHFNHG